MTEPTTKQIQERHDELDKLMGFSWPDAWEQTHIDRGILLKRLEASEKMATAFEDEMGEVHLKLETKEQVISNINTVIFSQKDVTAKIKLIKALLKGK